MRSFSSDDSRTATPELSASLPANLFRRYASPAFSSGQSPGQKSSTTATALPDLAHEKLVKRTRHLAAVKETESLRDPERVKAMKKRAKKLRQRMNARARTYETNQVGGSGQDSPNKTKSLRHMALLFFNAIRFAGFRKLSRRLPSSCRAATTRKPA
eukprot:m.153738 g.153738  ORF g.153738 m.153738 type:complete len:157 (+) comp38629_c0_seq8:2185-2655(+)